MRYARAPLALKIQKWNLTLVGHTRGLVGPENAGQVAEGDGARWRLSVSIPAMSAADARTVRAWLHSMRGQAGSCVFRVPGNMLTTVPPALNDDDDATALLDDDDATVLTDDDTAPGDGTGVTTAAAIVGATSVAITNATTGALVAGTLAYIGDPGSGTGQLVRVVSVSGTTITFQPKLRAAVSAGTRVAFGRVFGHFRLAGDVPEIPFVNSRSQPFQIELEEAY